MSPDNRERFIAAAHKWREIYSNAALDRGINAVLDRVLGQPKKGRRTP